MALITLSNMCMRLIKVLTVVTVMYSLLHTQCAPQYAFAVNKVTMKLRHYPKIHC